MKRATLVLIAAAALLAGPLASISLEDVEAPADNPLAGRASPRILLTNEMNDRLLALPKSRRTETLSGAVGDGCTGVSASPIGVARVGSSRGFAFWKIECSDGRRFAVQVAGGRSGNMTVLGSDSTLDCSLLRVAAGVDCPGKDY
jgi:hypothetical protein